MPRFTRRTLLILIPVVLAAGRVRAESAVEPAQFMRFIDDGPAGGQLQTAIVSYQNDAGQTVRLVGAIHIGEKAYYRDLNREFEKDDAVLYELVKSKSDELPHPGEESQPKAGNPVSQLQHFMKDVLNLSFQLDVIDYTKANFVHADLDKETFEKLQAQRGESLEMLMLKQMMDAFQKSQAAAPDTDDPDGSKATDQLVELFTRPDLERRLKLIFARQLNQMVQSGQGMDALDGTVLLTERNKAALKVLDDTLGSGKKHISIFYGAAHMPDLSKQLKTMGFHAVDVQWKRAWDLTLRPDAPSGAETLIRSLLKALDDQGGSE